MSWRTGLTAARRASCLVALGLALLAAAPLLAAGVRLPGLRGGELTDADLASGSHIVVVWAAWSPRCRDIVERLNALEAGWGSRARVVAVDFQEEPAEIEEFLRGKGLRTPVYLDRDGEFSKSLAVTSLPGLVVYRDGQVRYQGKLPAEADRVLQDLLR